MQYFRFIKKRELPEHKKQRTQKQRGVQSTSIHRPPKIQRTVWLRKSERDHERRQPRVEKRRIPLVTFLKRQPSQANVGGQERLKQRQKEQQRGISLKMTDKPGALCQIRQDRKSALFAQRIAGPGRKLSPGQGGHYQKTVESNISCRRR